MIKNGNKNLWKIIFGTLVGLLILVSFLLLRANKDSQSNLNVEVSEIDDQLRGIMSFTYNCDWVSNGQTIKCEGMISNNANNQVITGIGPLMILEDSKGCGLDCSDKQIFEEIGPKQTVTYSLSCTLSKKQDVTVMINPSASMGSGFITKC